MDASHTDNVKQNKPDSKSVCCVIPCTKFKTRQKRLTMLDMRTDYLEGVKKFW